MNDMTIKGKLAAALCEPSAPPGLVERTVVRAQAIVAGREAEQQLEHESALSPAEYMNLASQCVVGRLMQKQQPPANVSVDMMCRQLQQSNAFCRLTDQPPKKFLAEVKNGMFLHKLSEQMILQSGQTPLQKQAAPEIIKDNSGPTL